MKRVLLIEPDKELAGSFVGWLEGNNIGVKLVDDPDGTLNLLSNDQFDMLIVDIDYPGTTESLLELCKTLKQDTRYSDIPITVLTFKKEVEKIAAAIESGVDGLILKPFETGYFIDRIEALLAQSKLKKKGKKVLDLNFINFIINLAIDLDRDGFFALMTTVFNELIINKTKGILGEPVIIVLMKRINEMMEDDCAFMKQMQFADGRFRLDEIAMAAKNVSPDKLAIGCRRYIDYFLYLIQTLTSDVLMDKGRIR
ncbi:MAG: response regulator [Pseudomonadota bacterium]